MTVHFYGKVLDHTSGERSIEIEESPDLRALVDELANRYGGKFKGHLLSGDFCFFLINGKGVMATGGLGSKLDPDDKIEVLPIFEAG